MLHTAALSGVSTSFFGEAMESSYKEAALKRGKTSVPDAYNGNQW
jgi:hypothetical protein